jgi:GTP1/Obg family GTP-binding protein
MSDVPLPTTDVDTDLKLDAALFEAARSDVERLKRDYILALRTLEKTATREEDMRHAVGRLDRARASLAQALNILDFSRGDEI